MITSVCEWEPLGQRIRNQEGLFIKVPQPDDTLVVITSI